MKYFSTSILLLLFFTGLNQVQSQSVLTIDQIMQGEDFVGYLPSQVNWSDNSQLIYFSWNPDGDTIRSTYQLDMTSKEVNRLSIEGQKVRTRNGDYTKDYQWKVYEKGGDLFLVDILNDRVRPITNTIARESNPQFSGDESSIIYTLNNNFFQWNISDGNTTQLTDFREASDKTKKSSDQDQWLEKDQLTYFNILTKRQNEEEARKRRSEKTKIDRPETVYLGDKKLRGVTISPDLRYVVYQLEISAKDKNTVVPDYVTKSGFTTDLNARSKVGGSRDSFESWILDLQSDTADLSTGIRWYAGTNGNTQAKGDGPFAGEMNTAIIISSQVAIGDDGSTYAARICAELQKGGYGDWYLPSKDELNKMYKNLQSNGFGGFASAFYWSSTEVNSGLAWGQGFVNGLQSDVIKSDSNRVRAVRAF